ncbi:PaaI family thioesterase [Pseudomonas gessardii]|uniref:Hotdog fold thioesterase n=1 Tax=Pseudomonas gessardii TaxID=78544 RepID=A0A7Y1MUH5_9PSED|nr:PaaI family thioesterase [Pseudomonas gessardii]MBH3424095.1 PaaI family thioesterase [Pseudomonas gessardii]MCF4978576.1 hotdog fold thioesterase [Pseudomonas gessardii]MCF4989990.1 hotdog fold thioesterase [Pseudomonas gessardii]MCF5086959.1 hotdog fold thioesterase [Pseudomonas gessardii]MCF5095010.1 hotdog fold thioesterase [Pseudomonas gessardii]
MELPAGLTHSAFSELLGCRLQRLDQGVAEVALSLEPHLRNRAGKLHGGAIFSLVDIAMGLACSSAHGFDQQSATIECKINYIRAVSDGDVLCTARVIHPGRRTLVVEAEVYQGERLVAKAQGTFAVL